MVVANAAGANAIAVAEPGPPASEGFGVFEVCRVSDYGFRVQGM